jgi:hypothetical protein
MIDDILRYEDGLMTREETIDFFQKLVDNGKAWSLQGSYGRMAEALIKSGDVVDTHNVLGLELGPNDCE